MGEEAEWQVLAAGEIVNVGSEGKFGLATYCGILLNISFSTVEDIENSQGIPSDPIELCPPSNFVQPTGDEYLVTVVTTEGADNSVWRDSGTMRYSFDPDTGETLFFKYGGTYLFAELAYFSELSGQDARFSWLDDVYINEDIVIDFNEASYVELDKTITVSTDHITDTVDSTFVYHYKNDIESSAPRKSLRDRVFGGDWREGVLNVPRNIFHDTGELPIALASEFPANKTLEYSFYTISRSEVSQGMVKLEDEVDVEFDMMVTGTFGWLTSDSESFSLIAPVPADQDYSPLIDFHNHVIQWDEVVDENWGEATTYIFSAILVTQDLPTRTIQIQVSQAWLADADGGTYSLDLSGVTELDGWQSVGWARGEDDVRIYDIFSLTAYFDKANSIYKDDSDLDVGALQIYAGSFNGVF